MKYRFEIKPDKQRWFEGSFAIPTKWLNEELRQAIYNIAKVIPDVAYVSDAAGDYSFIKVVINNELYVHTDNHNLDAAINDYTAITGKHPFE